MRTTTYRNNRHHSHRGLTLLEVVMVIVMLGIVFSLLFPLLIDKREPYRRNQCSTHLNNLAKSAIQYEMANQHYPGWLQSYGRFNGTTGDPFDPNADPRNFAPHQKLGGWAIALLPYLDAQPTYEIWTDDQYPVVRGTEYTAGAVQNLSILQCPVRMELTDSRGRNSYVSNNGMHHLLPNGTIPAPLASADGSELAAFVGSMKPANGMFNHQITNAAVPPGNPMRSADLIDGLSHTVLFSENLQAFPWHQVRADEQASARVLLSMESGGNPALENPQAPVLGLVVESRCLQGLVWHWQDDDPAVQAATGCPGVNAVHRINGSGTFGGKERSASEIDVAKLPVATLAYVARPSSLHVGGVNISFADGGSRFVSESIDYRIYQALMTPHGEQSDVPMAAFTLTDGAF